MIGVVEKNHCPMASDEAPGFDQLRPRTPYRCDVLVDEYLHGRDQGIEVDPEANRRLAEARDDGYMYPV
ncbi:MAG TPA: hypothetical protein VG425_04460 [Casimicrobiaceae bacterium]|nr:hypothetical protein [Casimicrobiaceae bacterium]